ncbi:MAG: NIPSNAP family protein [Saprospiraceae bacterium]|nr:NIPSNAP family protein [Saprospiraceae bacterium]
MRILFLLAFCLAFVSCQHDHQAEHHASDQSHSSQHSKEHYEYRIYKASSMDQQVQVVDFLSSALIPAYHRHGVSTVGAFVPVDTSAGGYDIHTLVLLQDLSSLEGMYGSIYADPQFLNDGNAFLDQSDVDNPPYDRINTKLMVAFDSMPNLEIPSAGPSERVFEIRSYESASELRGMRKVHMFNEGGEVPIFKDLGFQPVFFAEAITGDEMPNLVYMIAFDQQESRADFWKSFGADPRWTSIKDLPQYVKTVSKIHSHIVKPIAGSDIK